MVKRRFLAIAIVAVSSMSLFAQEVKEVTLTVSGDGATKTEATQFALRSAIEQAFGVFVSANTQILNDELVKDEIATVSSGNIKEYEEIATASLPNSNATVTLKAIVSISKLITYAQSKGSSAEFAGATFAMNMKLRELNKTNEEKAIKNMVAQFEALAPSMFDYKLKLEEPKVNREGNYDIDAKVSAIPNENAKMIIYILHKTLNSLTLSKEEQYSYEQTNLRTYKVKIGTECSSSGNVYAHESEYILRASESYDLLYDFFNVKIYEAIINFKIIDNLNGISMINSIKIEGKHRISLFLTGKPSGLLKWTNRSGDRSDFILRPIPASWHDDGSMPKGLYIPFWYEFERPYSANLTLCIPKDDIMKYSNFDIIPILHQKQLKNTNIIIYK